MIHWVRAGLRLLFFALALTLYLGRYFTKAIFMGMDLDRGLRLRQEFIKLLLHFMGIQISQKGLVPDKAGVIVSNHRSYIDPLVVLSRIRALPVAKEEVRSWPMIGIGLRASGVFFVNRENADSRKRTRENLVQVLLRGYSILLYPEGTTHVNSLTIDFRPGVFKEAVKINAEVYPVAIAYRYLEDAWVGDDTFLRHFFARFGYRKMPIRVSYGPALQAADSELLRQRARQWIDAELQVLQEGWSDFSRITQ